MIKQIKQSIKPELDEFQVRFKESMKSQVPLLDRIFHYIIKTKGKQLRPLFVFLSAKAVGGITDSTYHAASLIELMHTATLVHDDVVDNSYQRRGFFSIYALWKHKIAVLVGDFLFAKGFILALDHKEYKLLHIISSAVKQMSEGELLQFQKSRKLDIDEGVYFQIIEQKTASLISSACESGAASSTENERWIEAFRQFGLHVGIAYQIKDDLFDYGQKDIGKPLGIDIKDKKMTLPLIHALNESDSKERRKIMRIIKQKKKSKSAVQEVIQFVHRRGGIDYAQKKMREYFEKAMDDLAEIPESPAKQNLFDLVTYVIEREH